MTHDCRERETAITAIDQLIQDGVIQAQRNGKGTFIGCSPTLLASDYKQVPLVLERKTMDKTIIRPVISSAQAHATVNNDLSPALTAAAGMGGGQTAMIIEPEIEVIGSLGTIGTTSEHNNRVHDPEGISPTATAVAGGTHHIKIFDHTKYRVRKLTPTEYGRLQAFPMDNWKQVVSNSQAYKQFGNAVTVTLAEGIGKSVIGYLDSVLGGATV